MMKEGFAFALLASFVALAQAGKLWNQVCTQPDTKSLPFCNRELTIPARVEDYVKRVSLADKAANMQNGGAGIESLHIPPYQWGSEGLHGPLQPCVCTPDNTTCKCPTSFPCPSAMGTAFNDSLYFMVGQADGREARAINNLRNHVTQNQYGDGIDYWSPTLNMQRDPRWGRNQEVPGEDPMLTGNYAANFVQGLQGDVGGLDTDHVQIAACCKHFIANSMEHWGNATRNDFDANVPMSDMRNYYLPPFRSCVMEGRSKGVMCSYNAVTIDGVFKNVPSCANDWLLQTTLRDSWRFEGYVTSDCGAVNNECQAEPKGHGVYNCTEAAALSIKAGTDVDCGPIYSKEIINAVAGGLLDEALVDQSFARLSTIQMELGLFDNNKAQQPYFNLGIDHIDTAAHKQLALEAAQQAIVLLKNDGVLPLRPGKKIAVVGPHFNATDLLISNYHGSRCVNGHPGDGKDFSCIVSPMEAIAAMNSAGETTGAQGCDVAGSSTHNIAAAVATAAAADVVILALGIDQTQEREGEDRVITTLPGMQRYLVAEVLALQKPTIVVLFNGGAMSLGDINNEAGAIVDAFYGGQAGAIALADVLFGAYNPSGKLAATMYPAEYVDEIPLTEMGLTVGPGRTHMFYKGKPEYPFGFGLSYSVWGLQWGDAEEGVVADIEWSLGSATNKQMLEVVLSNIGGVAGRQNVLMFWRPKGAELNIQQKLVGYRGTGRELAPGKKHVLHFTVDQSLLQMAGEDGEMALSTGEYELFVTVGDKESILTRKLCITS